MGRNNLETMKNNSNIYDFNGDLIRAFDDTHKWTIEEAQEKIKEYQEKIKEVGEDSKEAIIYATYIRNLTKYIWEQYAKMTPEEFAKHVEIAKKERSTSEQVENAINELKKELEDENDRTTEESISNKIPGTIPGDNESNTNTEFGDDTAEQRESSDVHEEGPTAQSDLLVERTDVNNSMDEYVTFEEVK